MRRKSNKKFLAIPIISGLILMGIWFGPHLHKLDISIEDGDITGSIELTAEDHEEPQADATDKDWQQLVTWVIGALNGLFGVLLIGKKILSK